ncbi:MAG: CarD family transcriptional regulator [Faecousia sp.]
MYQIGDKVVYGIHGVCSIADTEVKTVDRKEVTYLVLEPQGQPGSRYLVPTHNVAAMGKLKKMLSGEEMDALIRSESVRQDAWIRDESQRKQVYRELISSGDRERLMAMVHTLYRHKSEQHAAGKKVHLCDDNFLRDAEKLLISEISIVMNMEPEEAKKYVRQQLGK